MSTGNSTTCGTGKKTFTHKKVVEQQIDSCK